MDRIAFTETVAFMSIARETVANLLEYKGADKELVNYIINEASDYQVMCLLLDKPMPKEKYNALKEAEVFAEFKLTVAEYAEALSEAFGFGMTYSLLENIVPPTALGISTAKPILEHQLALYEQEGPLSAGSDPYKAAGEAIKRFWNWFTKPQVDPKYLETVEGTPLKSGEEPVKELLTKAKKTGESLFSKLKSYLQGEPPPQEKPVSLIDKIRAAVEQFMSANPAVAPIAATLFAAIVTFALYKLYKSRFSLAAKACNGKPDKKLCMLQFQVNEYEQQMQAYKKAAGVCPKTKDPKKCKNALDSKVAKLQKKVEKLKKKIQESKSK
ncbi:MAG: hypothetical protein KatS3mg002_0270 [Candidatus Woesearchaeota archaeon]|nr:MAG: hypothetical protein KatS3mg002_0270 [Candidatus Woesearchaeota archaeon]